MSDLREEIIASEQLRADLVKWKLIIVATLGAAGLGFTEHAQPGVGYAYLVLLLVPFVCFYVDLLCRHIAIRITVIGTFIRLGFCGVETAYEAFVDKTRQNIDVFVLEDWVLQGSTTILSMSIIFGGVLFLVIPGMAPGSIEVALLSIPTRWVIAIMFICSGLAGVILSRVTEQLYERRANALRKMSEVGGLVDELGSIIARSAPAVGMSPSQPNKTE